MEATENEKNQLCVTAQEFAELMRIERVKQKEIYGVDIQFDLPRWLSIVGEEFGKAIKLSNELTLMAEGRYTNYTKEAPIQIRETKFKLRDELLQISTCCLAVLQESPVLYLFK